jgi:hypothetical protein
MPLDRYRHKRLWENDLGGHGGVRRAPPVQGEPVSSRVAERVTTTKSVIWAVTTISVSRDRTACRRSTRRTVGGRPGALAGGGGVGADPGCAAGRGSAPRPAPDSVHPIARHLWPTVGPEGRGRREALRR